jgi:protease I
MESLKGLKVAILADDGFEQVELTRPRKALDVAGAETSIVSPKREQVRGWNFTKWREDFPGRCPSPAPTRRTSTRSCFRGAS